MIFQGSYKIVPPSSSNHEVDCAAIGEEEVEFQAEKKNGVEVGLPPKALGTFSVFVFNSYTGLVEFHRGVKPGAGLGEFNAA